MERFIRLIMWTEAEEIIDVKEIPVKIRKDGKFAEPTQYFLEQTIADLLNEDFDCNRVWIERVDNIDD